MNNLHTWLEHLSWMSPSLGLALVAGLVVALIYAAVAARPLRALPFYWFLGLCGFAVGQVVAGQGAGWLRVGDFALGSGLVACIVLFTTLHALTLWYTRGRHAIDRARLEPLRRKRLR